MQLGNQAGGAFVHRHLLLLRLRLIASQKQVAVDVLGKVGQRVGERRCVGVQVVEVQVLKVADEHVLRQLGLLQAGQVLGGLAVGFLEVFAARLHLDQQLAGVKAVNAPVLAAQGADALLKIDQAPVGKAKYLAQAPDKVLPLAHLVARLRKLPHKAIGPADDFVPAQCDRHPCRFFV